MKSVLISIKPKWCELIASGKKTVEVRKTKPKLETPFKVYIYCTYGEGLIEANDEFLPNHLIDQKVSKGKIWANCCNGKVIGEFVCDDIIVDERGENSDILRFYGNLTHEELWEYGRGKTLYGWHISDLVIYDKPRELSEFYNYCNGLCFDSSIKYKCISFNPDNPYACDHLKPITRPPQSWCYVESEDTE
jgi:predicted transcriptional regulator